MTDLHLEAARIIKKFNSKEGFIKNLVYSSAYKNLRQLFALVSESIKYRSILATILKKSNISLLSEELVGNNEELALVLLYEELVGAGFGHAGHVRKMMRKYKKEIKGAHNEILEENNAKSLADILSGNSTEGSNFPTLPRYARVNLLKGTVQEGIDRLCQDGWEYQGRLHVEKFKEEVSSLSEYQFGLDPLLDDVLVFPISTDLHKDRLVMDGILVLQERASCVPAHVLNPPPGSTVLDCCAAPGNKTSHLASLMGDQGHVIALDRDAKRVLTMNSLLQRTGATCVETIAQDFLTLSPESEEVLGITMILLDPSCSCTGMPTGTSYRQEVPIHRLLSLKRYQISLLKHALRFPNVQRIVYSTCSTSRQENEEVVEEVMCHVKRCFKFVPVLPEWPNSRGMKKFLHHQSFLRVSPEEHLSAGFFVACFERINKLEKSLADSPCNDEMNSQNCGDNVPIQEDFERKCDNGTDSLDSGLGEKKKKKKKKKHRKVDEENDEGSRIGYSLEKNDEREDVVLTKNINSEGQADSMLKAKGKKRKRIETGDTAEKECDAGRMNDVSVQEDVEFKCEKEIDAPHNGLSEKHRRKKKKKHRKEVVEENLEESKSESDNEDSHTLGKNSKREDTILIENVECHGQAESKPKTNGKKRKRGEKGDSAEKAVKKEKGCEAESMEFPIDSNLTLDDTECSVHKKKKKKKSTKDMDDISADDVDLENAKNENRNSDEAQKKKKKNKDRSDD